MKTMYITIAGMNHYYGSEIFEKGMKVKLEKEPDNPYDREAIAARIKGLGKIGYVANSPYTVQGESMSAGRLYDKIGDTADAEVQFVLSQSIICRVNSRSQENKTGKPR
ncbi:HIRAN domain-containing protein [Zhenpiania hominis]|uniref:HIRAN domain-containing protein n=1 Tax=Zhenpiania hominis TaxID=2763644 RepID=UPI0039F57279